MIIILELAELRDLIAQVHMEEVFCSGVDSQIVHPLLRLVSDMLIAAEEDPHLLYSLTTETTVVTMTMHVHRSIKAFLANCPIDRFRVMDTEGSVAIFI